MLNWRRDPGYEQRMKQLRNEIEQLRLENARLAKLNARDDALSAKRKAFLSYVDQHCLPDEFSSTPLPPTATDSSSS